ncbi:unnamed protein product [Symbiodinium microadriaticum]|nr:unnamed protein product [Symbiodinium sp. KB8]CAE7380916.1 unnamed protein product [Symbiodinium microadriaticum]
MGRSAWHKKGGRGRQNEPYGQARDQPWPKDHYGGQGGSWQLWRGAWSPSRKEDYQRYDQVQLEEQQPSSSESSLMKGASGFMRAVQKSLTTAKRCETKIRKLQEERSTRDAKWQTWQAKMRAEYTKQKRLYEGDIARIDREVVSQREQGEQAAQSMTELIAGGMSAMEVPMESTEEADDWEAFISQSTTNDQMSDFMRQAMESAAAIQRGQAGLPVPRGQLRTQTGLSMMPARLMESLVGCPPRAADPGSERPRANAMEPPPNLVATAGPGQTTETLPPAGVTAPPEMNPMNPTPAQAYAPTDANTSRPGPYTRSPGAKSPIPGGKHPVQEASPGQAPVPAAPHHRPLRDPQQQRRPVKTQTNHVVHPTHAGGIDLATKLEHKRAATPFHPEGTMNVPPQASSEAAFGFDLSAAPAESGENREPIFVDDDHPSPPSAELDEHAWCGLLSYGSGELISWLIGAAEWSGTGAVIVDPEWTDVIPEGFESIPPMLRSRCGYFQDPEHKVEEPAPTGSEEPWSLRHLLCPYVEACRQFAETSAWLGVALYSPGFFPKYLGLSLPVPTSVEAVVQALSRLQAAPHAGEAFFAPVHPQRFGGYVSFVAYHPVIDMLCPARKAVVLDLSHVGGHYHCLFLPGSIIVADLLEMVQQHITHDVEQVAVWAGDPPFRLHYNQVLELAHGMALLFLLRDYNPGLTPAVSEVIANPPDWGPLEHLPLCIREAAVLVHHEDEMFTLRRRGGPDESLLAAVSQALKISSSALSLLATREFGVIDFWGTPCTALLTVFRHHSHSFDSNAPSGKLVFVDGRVFGIRPRVLELCPVTHFVSDLLQQVNIELPDGFDVDIQGCQICGNSIFALLGSAIKLYPDAPMRYAVLGTTLRHAQPAVGPEQISALLHDDRTPTLEQAEAAAAGPFGPRPVFAPRFAFDEEDDPMDDDDDQELVIRAKFVILSLECTPEVLSLELPSPCALPQLFAAVAEGRDPRRTQLFPQLVPVIQQPTQFWGTLIALPAWAEGEPIVLFNLLEVDGRYFLSHVPAVADKGTLCSLAGIPNTAEVAIYAFGSLEPLPEGRLLDIVGYGCLFFVPTQGRPVHGWNLSWMLLSPYSWDPEAIVPVGPGGVFGATDQLSDSWQLVYAPDNLIDLAELTTDLGTFAPVLTAQFVRDENVSTDSSSDSTSSESGDSDGDSDGGRQDMVLEDKASICNHLGFGGFADASSSSCPALQQRYSNFEHALSGGPQPDTSAAFAFRAGVSPNVFSLSARAAGLRPIPTPCRSHALPNIDGFASCLEGWAVTGPTLLEISTADKNFRGFYEAQTLLEVLCEHHASLHGPDLDNVPRVTASPVLTLSLADTLPVTSFQCQCLELRAIVPRPAVLGLESGGFLDDWLDNDIVELSADCHVPASIRRLLKPIQLWHRSGRSLRDIAALHIYTDGSATTGSQEVAPASWAFGVWCETEGDLLYFGGAAGCAVPESTPYHVGETADTPVQAELLALTWAFAWVLQFAPSLHMSVCFHYDATSVGRGVFGEHKAVACPSVQDGIPLAAFCSHLRQYAEQLLWVYHSHVKSHTGCVPNELVDQMAKRIRRQGDSVWERCLPSWPAVLFRHPLVAWTWTLAGSHHDLPNLYAFESEASRLQAAAYSPVEFPRYDQARVQVEGGVVELSITAISYNALTLKDKQPRETMPAQAGLRVIGRRAVLISELRQHRPLFVGLQETRLQETATLPDSTYIMFQAGATERGVGGCALWVARGIPYAHHGGKPLFLDQSHAVVSGFSHRHITVCFDAPLLRLMVVVAHCPSLANHPVTEVCAFWRARLDDLQRRPRGMDYLILVDSNARVGDTVTEAIGPHQAEPETPAGALFHDFVLAAEGFVPATFSDFQEGPGDTWCSATGALHRIDSRNRPSRHPRRLAIGIRLELVTETRTQTDRYVVLAQLERLEPLQGRGAHREGAPAGRSDDDPQERRAQIEIISRLPTAPWWADVDRQYDFFVSTLRTASCDLAVKTDKLPSQPYLTAGTLELVDFCRELRQYLRQETRERERRLQMIAFASFILFTRGEGFSDRGRCAANRWLWELDLSEARGAALLRHFVTRVRNAVKADRRAYLQGLVSEVGQCQIRDPQALYRALRRAFPTARSARRSSLTPLPAVIVKDDQLAVTPADKTECWRKHFGDQEAGEAVDASQYLDAYSAQRSRRVVEFDPKAVPTLFEIEQTIIGLKRAKAPGPDGVTSDMLRLVPARIARKLLPVVIKSSLAICEPIAWRGGSLHCLAKKAGAALQCQQFRSILLASTPGKVWHRATRNRLIPLLQKHGHATQAGSVAGISIEAISLLVRTYQASRHHSPCMWSLVFYDLQAAFYKVVRETLFQSDDSDGEISRIVAKLGLPPEAMPELARQLRTLAILPQFGASDHLAAIVEDMLSATWFTIGVSDVITLTHKGSRPGDPAADVIFSLVFAAFVRQVEQHLFEQGLLLPLPRHSQVHPWAQIHEKDTIGLPSWADDFVSPVEAEGPRRLLEVSKQTITLVLARASAIGMKLTFAVDKTAVLLPCGWDWCQYGATQDAEHGLGFWVVDPLTKEEHHVPIVEAYKHLGHILTSSTSPQPDIQLRRSRAQGAIKPLRTKLFGNRDIPIATRRLLLQSLAVSRFTHSSAALILPAAVHERLWDRAYLDLWRPLIPRKAADKQAHSFEVLRVAQSASPPLMMAHARANFLKQLTSHGPSVLRHVLFVHWRAHAKSSWLAQIAEDVSLVLQYLPGLSPLFPSSKRLESLLDSLLEDPGWWLRQVRKAVRVFGRDLQVWHDKGMPSVRVATVDSPEADLPYACPLCVESSEALHS